MAEARAEMTSQPVVVACACKASTREAAKVSALEVKAASPTQRPAVLPGSQLPAPVLSYISSLAVFAHGRKQLPGVLHHPETICHPFHPLNFHHQISWVRS